MNEEALQQLYGLAQLEGYARSYNEFKVLMNQDEQAVSQMYLIAQADGYSKQRSDFDVLVGFGQIPQEVKDEFAKDPDRDWETLNSL